MTQNRDSEPAQYTSADAERARQFLADHNLDLDRPAYDFQRTVGLMQIRTALAALLATVRAEAAAAEREACAAVVAQYFGIEGNYLDSAWKGVGQKCVMRIRDRGDRRGKDRGKEFSGTVRYAAGGGVSEPDEPRPAEATITGEACETRAFLEEYERVDREYERNLVKELAAARLRINQLEAEVVRLRDPLERRADGALVRKDRWEMALRNIAIALYGTHGEFETVRVVEDVRQMKSAIDAFRCGRCGAVKGTHGSPCIDDPAERQGPCSRGVHARPRS